MPRRPLKTPAPRTYLEDPRQYGRTAQPAWKSVPAAERAALRAAQIQHELAYQVRQALAPEHDTPLGPRRDHGTLTQGLRALAEATGDSLDYLRRKLHGEQTATLTDLINWADTCQITYPSARSISESTRAAG